MAADPFFFASLEARSMSFPSCNHSLFWRFRFPPLYFHTLRFSPPKLKFNHQFVVSKCSSSDSVSADVDIISATGTPFKMITLIPFFVCLFVCLLSNDRIRIYCLLNQLLLRTTNVMMFDSVLHF